MIHAYYPKPLFPPISLSEGCMLMCKHCMGKYLHGMTTITNPEKLIDFCVNLEGRGGKGILVSGGSDSKGRIIGLEKSLNALKRVREETDLVIAVHAGYVDRETADGLADACDIAFVDMVGSDETVREVIGLDGMNRYVESLSNLVSAGITVTPHVTIGLHYGKVKGEYAAVKEAVSFPVKKIVFNVILPTKGTDFENIEVPEVEEIGAIIRMGREAGAGAALGCMRPRGIRKIEEEAIASGVEGIALPSKDALRYAGEKGYEIEEVPACCGLTDELMKKITD